MWPYFIRLLGAARRPLVVLDFETAGLDGAPPVEYAVAIWAPWQTTSDDPTTASAKMETPVGLTYAATSRLNPRQKIQPAATAVHGLRDCDVADALPYDDVELRAVFRGLATGDPGAAGGAEGPAVFVGHNAAESDVPWAQRWGYLPSDPAPTVLDTMRLARRLTKEHPMPLAPDAVSWRHCPAVGHGLEPYSSSLVGLHTALFGDPPKQVHGALADTLSTARALAAILDLWSVLWLDPVAPESPTAAIDRILAKLTAPPAGEVSWDGWLRRDRDTRRVTWSRKARKLGEGAPLKRDLKYAQWVASLPSAPTGVTGEAWCSDETRRELEAAMKSADRAVPDKERGGQA